MDDIKITLDDESLTTILRTNLSCYLGKIITQELSNEVILQIIDSIKFVLNKKGEESIKSEAISKEV